MKQLQTAPKVDAELDIEKLFFDAVDVRVRRASSTVPCTMVNAEGTAGARTCGDEGVLVDGRKVIKMGSSLHDCIIVRSPKDGVLELEVRAQPWMPLITRARVAVMHRVREGEDSPSFEVWSNGVFEGRRGLRADGHTRIAFASPREALLLRVGGEGPSSRDVCITLTERAWRYRPPKKG